MSPVVVTPAVLRDWPLPAPGESKHARGQVLVVAGAAATAGAVLLAGEATLRAGAGKLALATVDRHVAVLGAAVPESAVTGLRELDGSIAPDAAADLKGSLESCDVLLAGPGFLDPDAAGELCGRLLEQVQSPVVLDALATAYLVDHPDALRRLEGRAVLNLNPGELARLGERDEAPGPDEVGAVAGAVAERTGAVVLCGGTEKLVAAPDGRCWVIQGGGPGLGVSGSGDVQAGLIAGLVARGAGPEQAAVWAAHLHARAGERLAARLGTVGYLARELLAEIPQVLGEVG
ncbi:NAD(P)H-hydrate dehydratase [Nocardioides pantholopis]|uniref:NAD(P)H-hydrate dehydratase n=1 Tax=Nocardioides pantholopis TaxID=2483798 RepID=UPI000F09A190|nr:NAD(P)H-hydrate dehydratase [Nocardioides pantholopis]